MSTSESSGQLVARFLRSNHYYETLEAFLREAGLPEDAGSLKTGAWTIEQILQEKLQFDTSINFEKQGKAEKHGWTVPAPNVHVQPQVDSSSNVLRVHGDGPSNSVLVSAADRSLKRFSGRPPHGGDDSVTLIGDSPVLSTVFVPGGYLLTTSMSGQLSLRMAGSYQLVDECRHHQKYTVQVVSHCQGGEWYIATAGWDQRIHIYAPDMSRLVSAPIEGEINVPSQPGFLGNPISTIKVVSNPESIVFAVDPDTGKVYLIASRRDSTHLYYYLIDRDASAQSTVQESGKQNLAPHSNAWVGFTPCSLCLCPTDPTLLAVATSHLPHMKLIIARLLFPGARRNSASLASDNRTQASAARAELALQDREDAAIMIQVSTMAPQTPYSTPQVVWRPDGSGLFVNGDDGVIRGIEANTGKVVAHLKGHEAGSKVRTLWAGLINHQSGGQADEVLVSGAFDKKVFMWKVAQDL